VCDGQNTQVKLNMEELPFAEFDIYNNRRFLQTENTMQV
jgi:hypothetical protein